MNTTTSVVLTGGIVTIGTWAQGKQIGIKNFVGIGVLAVALAALGEVNAKFAQQFSVLVLVAALFYYGTEIAQRLNKQAPPSIPARPAAR